MVILSIKCCWSKFYAGIRDAYLDAVDSYYRAADPNNGTNCPGTNAKHKKHRHNHHHRHNCNKVNCAKENNNNRANQDHKSYSQQQQHNRSGNTSQVSAKHYTNDYHQNIPPIPITKNPTNIPLSKRVLPRGFTKRVTSKGQVVFCDQYGSKHYYDPSVPRELLTASLDLDAIIGELSTNWEVRQTGNGKTYYVNHIKKTTQFTDPRLVAYKDHLCSRYLRNRQQQYTSSSSVQPLRNVSKDTPRNNSTHNSTCDFRARNSNKSSVRDKTTIHHHSTLPNNRNRGIFAEYNPQTTTNRPRMNRLECGGDCSTRHLRSTEQLCTSGNYKRQSNPNQNYQRGSHHNLSVATNDTTATNHSNTLTGPLPTWLTSRVSNDFRNNARSNSPVNPHSMNNSSIAPELCPNTPRNEHSDLYPRNEHSDLYPSYMGPCTNVYSYLSSPSNPNPTSPQLLLLRQQHYQYDLELNRLAQSQQPNRELFDKISILRQELLKQQVVGHPCRIDISRRRIFEDSFRVISMMQTSELKKRLLVKFKGEEGLDYGGVAREWFYLLSREMLNPIHGLFQYTSDDIYNLQINPDSGIVYREHLSYLHFCGRILGMAVFHGHFIEGHFTLPFYKMLLRIPITLNDIELVDPDLYRSLCWILDNDITNVIDTTFSVQHNALGQLQEHELKVGGRSLVVTEENKHEYVSLYVNYRCRRGIESQFEALQRGFYELLSPSLVENFDEHELELLIGGSSKINIDDWRLNTKLKNCNVETPLVRWFWDIVKSYGEDKRARLLQFVTGSPRVPIQGFKALQGVNSELRLFTIHLIKNACTDNLPKSHTCFNRIDLPPYENYEKLRDKLTQAIEETMGFAMQ